ncbi:CPBP family intramembrane glutamic endopeptidase [Legionella sp. W05-934-2]|uniref:CPBP family intramembrane glutamic endopeptidase n=1 Tax=Legionella sp. W05-934-2 TaxID=1198649 RepID=UPI003461AE3B
MASTVERSNRSICNDVSTNPLPFHKKKYPFITGLSFFDPSAQLANTAIIPSGQTIANQTQKNKDKTHDPLSYFMVMGLVIVSSTVAVPYFHVGLFMGVASFFIKIPIAQVLQRSLPINTHVNKANPQTFDFDPLDVSLFAPILEELMFRGFMQPTLLLLIPMLIPSTATVLIASGLSAAALISILITSVAFGLAHIGNNHSGSYVQGVLCTLSGLNLGLLALYFGLPAAIASHIANNTLAVTTSMLLDGKTAPESQNTKDDAYAPPMMTSS